MPGYKDSHNRIGTFLSIAVLLLLVITGTLIFLKQFRYAPSIFPSGMMLSITSSQPLLDEKPESALSLKNMAPMTPPETFNEDNLSEKINGKAELYLSAGFKSLTSQRFKKPGDTDSWLEVFKFTVALNDERRGISECETAEVDRVIEYNSIGGEHGGWTWPYTGRRTEIEL